ncbi:YDG domain-containing protein [Azorhizophilus paspali]|uniref:YDG domain-containing protein n=1 Tax=Azorhizophilus paspali TaxID=69963 RepID=A0ABV6SGQ9_AZOPA
MYLDEGAVQVDRLQANTIQLGYGIGYLPSTLTIDRARLILSASPDSKTYDGTVASSGTVGVAGLATSDTLTATQRYDSAEAGERTLQVDEVAIDIATAETITK